MGTGGGEGGLGEDVYFLPVEVEDCGGGGLGIRCHNFIYYGVS